MARLFAQVEEAQPTWHLGIVDAVDGAEERTIEEIQALSDNESSK